MTALATNVGRPQAGAYKRKTRGTWGEMQLARCFEQVLSPANFVPPCHVRPPQPGGGGVRNSAARASRTAKCFLPIDSKFPWKISAPLPGFGGGQRGRCTQPARRAYCGNTHKMSRTMQNKYIVPPHTTDFAVCISAYRGALRHSVGGCGLLSQRKENTDVTVMGPATLGALLNSLHMGFRTLAVRSIWPALEGYYERNASKNLKNSAVCWKKTQKKISGLGETLSVP